MSLVIVKFNCRICCHEQIETYTETASIADVTCPECRVASISADKSKVIVTAWIPVLEKQNTALLSTVKEGKPYPRLTCLEEGFCLSDGEDFEVEVELAH